MKFMILVKASKDSEAGVMPNEELLSAMGKFNEELADDELATRSESHADSDLTRAVGGTGSEETAQIGARGQ